MSDYCPEYTSAAGDFDMGPLIARGVDAQRIRRLTCPYCKCKAKLAMAAAVYPDRNLPGKVYVCNRFPRCDSYVGVHNGTNIPKGTLANKDLRAARMRAHGAFDSFWRSRHWSRAHAYETLALHLTLSRDKAHIGQLDIAQCEKVVAIYGGPAVDFKPILAEGTSP